MDDNEAILPFGAEREKRIHAESPRTRVLNFEDHRFEVQTRTETCALCGAAPPVSMCGRP